MTRPRLLDLFCGAGGTAMGYHRAGFDVVGVDIAPQPHYPFECYQEDALFVLNGASVAGLLSDFDAIHASPPCQRFSLMSRGLGITGRHLDLLTPTRELLQRTGLPWVIENVPGAPMRTDYRLCGCMFGLPGLRRDRWFETSWRGFALNPSHDHSEQAITVVGGGPDHGNPHKAAPIEAKRRAMGIDWMNRDELSQAIPPAYTEYIGRQLLAHLTAVTA